VSTVFRSVTARSMTASTNSALPRGWAVDEGSCTGTATAYRQSPGPAS
jgi:hypothetical protein